VLLPNSDITLNKLEAVCEFCQANDRLWISSQYGAVASVTGVPQISADVQRFLSRQDHKVCIIIIIV